MKTKIKKVLKETKETYTLTSSQAGELYSKVSKGLPLTEVEILRLKIADLHSDNSKQRKKYKKLIALSTKLVEDLEHTINVKTMENAGLAKSRDFILADLHDLRHRNTLV